MRQLKKQEVKQLMKTLPKREQEIVLLLENLQYARNVAGIFRTADAAGVRRIILTGISQQPPFGNELQKASRQKEKKIPWEYFESTGKAIKQLKHQGFYVMAVELADDAIPMSKLAEHLEGKDKVCLILGNEVYGVVRNTLEKVDASVYLPLYGKGASMNVATTAGIVLYAF